MLTDILTVSLLGGIMCLDRNCVQVMISRPIVVAPMIGLILGDVQTGLMAGAFMELLWSDRLPIGTYVPPNDSIVSVLIASSAILASKAVNHDVKELLALSVLLFVPVGRLTQKIDTLLIKANDGLSRTAVMKAEEGDTAGVARLHIKAIARSLCCNFLVIMVSLAFGIGVMVWTYSLLTQPLIHALRMTYLFLPLIGAAVAMNTIRFEGIIPVFCSVYLVVMILLELIRAY